MSVDGKRKEELEEERLKKDLQEKCAGELGPMANIEHVVVLVLENRGFDHFLGYLYGDDGDAEGDPAKINSVGARGAVNAWTRQPLRKFEGLAGLKDDLSCGYNYKVEEGKKKPVWTRTGKDAPGPRRGARAPTVPRINAHEDFVHVFEDMYYDSTSMDLKSDKLYREMSDPAIRDRLLMKGNQYRQPAMRGWAQNYADAIGHHASHEKINHDTIDEILDIYTPEQLPVLSFLARHYAVSDLWFCSVPSQTSTNRAFLCAGTARGLVKNSFYEAYPKSGRKSGQVMKDIADTHSERFPPETLADGRNCIGTRTLFDILTETGTNPESRVSWKYYNTSEWPSVPFVMPGYAGHYFSLMYPQFRKVLEGREACNNPWPAENFAKIDRFWADCHNGTLPAVSYIEPLFGGGKDWNGTRGVGNEFHPACDTACGEFYVRKIYEALSANKEKWPKTLLVITFDENGGTYDHLAPWPARPTGRDSGELEWVGPRWKQTWVAENGQDGKPNGKGSQFGFRFDMYGVRVPTILVSPWIRPNTVFRSPTDTPFDHCSLLKTIINWARGKKKNVPARTMLGARTEQAPTFESAIQGAPLKSEGGWEKEGYRTRDDPALGIWPSVRPGKEKEQPLKRTEAVRLRYLGNKWAKKTPGQKDPPPLYLAGPLMARGGGFGSLGWYYPRLGGYSDALRFHLKGEEDAPAELHNGELVELALPADLGGVVYRLAVPANQKARGWFAATSAYFDSNKKREPYVLWHVFLVGDRSPKKKLYHGDQVFLFTDRYWWEPNWDPNVSIGAIGYDPYQKLSVALEENEGEQVKFRAGEWDIWVIERAPEGDGPSAPIEEPEKAPQKVSEPKPSSGDDDLVALSEELLRSAGNLRTVAGQLMESYVAYCEKQKSWDLKALGGKADIVRQALDRGDRALADPGRDYKSQEEPKSRSGKLNALLAGRNPQPTEKDGNCLFHAVFGALSHLRKPGVTIVARDAAHCRNLAVDQIETSAALREEYQYDLRDFVKSDDEYYRHMRQMCGPGESDNRRKWGGLLEVAALAQATLAQNEKKERVPIVLRVIAGSFESGYQDFGKGQLMIELFHGGRDHWEWLESGPSGNTFHLALTGSGGRPVVGQTWELKVGGGVYKGKTTGEGIIDVVVREKEKEGLLILTPDDANPDDVLTFNVLVGDMPPVSDLLGVKARLNALGCNAGWGPQEDAHLTEAIKEFEKSYLEHDEPGGVLDQPMRKQIDDAWQRTLSGRK